MYSKVPFIRNPLENVLYQNDVINQEREKHVIQRTEDTTQDNKVKPQTQDNGIKSQNYSCAPGQEKKKIKLEQEFEIF